ncbi:MAG: poly-gamma-glutamate hydrolase family protein [Pyrinomonadaceae bacterium]
MKTESSNIRPRGKTTGAANIGGRSLGKRLPLVVAAACACLFLMSVQARTDYYHCYQTGNCTAPALSNATDCVEGTDYTVTASNTGAGVTVLSIHGGYIEIDTSAISAALASLYGWNRYDFNSHASTQCLNGLGSDSAKLHITATHFDDPRVLSLVGANPRAVAIHGYGAERGYPRGAVCVGGLDAAARNIFISYVNGRAASWNPYPLNAIDATTASNGATCDDVNLRGIEGDNIVNRTSGGGGLQLELSPGLRDDLVNTSASYDTLRNIVYGAVNQAVGCQSGCATADSAGTNTTWQNIALVSNQTGTFTAEMDATPLGTNIDAGVGLSNGAQTTFSGLACIARFNAQGKIDARNGSSYAAASSIPYLANTPYHLRFVVNVPAHTYSVYVTPAGSVEQAVGTNYAFRSEQATVAGLNNWSLFADAGSLRGCGLGAPCYGASAGGGWVNNAFAAQAGSFTAEWDATPAAVGMDAVVGLSNGVQSSFAGFACLARFNAQGTIDARDGGTYRAATSLTYAANMTYHFRLAVNVPAHTYSVYVTPPGGIEQVVGLNYAFRTEQAAAVSLNSYGLIVDSAAGSARVCNFNVGGSNLLFRDAFTGADGLITNEYAHWNSGGINSPDWNMTSGSLFRQSNAAWTGVPDSNTPDKFSSSATGSNVFRLNTFRTFAGNIKVSLALKNNSDIHDLNCNSNDTCWHGVHIWLRHQTQYDLYSVSINRADNQVIVKRKVPCGTDNQGTYFVLAQAARPWAAGTWQHFSMTVQTNGDGSVTLKVYDDDTGALITQGTDSGGTNPNWSSGCMTPGRYPTAQYPPLTSAGSVGVRGDYDNFNFDEFTVASF